MPWEPIDPKDVPAQYRTGKTPEDYAATAEETRGMTPGSALDYMDKLGNGLGIMGRAVGDMATGRKNITGDYPEFTPTTAFRGPNGDQQDKVANMATAFGLASAQDPLGYAKIVKEWLPDAQITFDTSNNPLIKWGGNTYYANKPGVSGNDFRRLASDMLAYLPAAKWAQTGTMLATKGLKGGAGSIITNLVQQMAGQSMGSEEPLSLGMAGVAGMTGVASEVLAPFLTSGAQQLWQRLGKGVLTDAKGNPTPFGRSFVEQVGLDPDNVTAGMWTQLDKYYRSLDGAMKAAMQRGAQEAQQTVAGATNAAMQEAVPGTIPKTAGQQTRNQELLDFEELARTGRAGSAARTTLGDFDQRQSAAVMDRTRQLQEMAGGGQIRSQTPEGLGAAISEGVASREAQAWKGVGNAYDAVPTGVRLDADPLLSVPNAAMTSLRNEGIFPDRAGFDIVYPRANKALSDLREVMAQKAALPPSKRSFGLMELEQERKAINVMMRGAEGPDLMALGKIKSTFDTYIEKTWDDALLKGDPAALEQLKAARVARTEYGKMFEPQNVDQTVTNTINKMVTQPDLDNNSVVNWIFGTTETGFGKAGLQMTKQLGKIFGKGSDEWNAMREAAMMKIIYGNNSNAMRDAEWNGAKVISKSSQQLLRRLDNYLDLQGSQVMKELFTKPELDQLRRFRYELRQIQPGENASTLRTGASHSLWMMKVGSWIDGAIKAKTAGLGPEVSSTMANITNGGKAQAATAGWQPPQPRSIPIFQSLLMGAGVGGGEAYRRQQQPPPQ